MPRHAVWSLARIGGMLPPMSTAHDTIMDYLLEDPPQPVSPAERTRAWRQRMREEGRPELKVVDAALVEATSFLLSLATGSPVTVEVAALVRVATIILVRDGYDRTHSKTAVIDRLRPRNRHSEVSAMPSRNLSSNPLVIQPPQDGEWFDKDLAFIRKLAGK